jgi:hypothetical protein
MGMALWSERGQICDGTRVHTVLHGSPIASSSLSSSWGGAKGRVLSVSSMTQCRGDSEWESAWVGDVEHAGDVVALQPRVKLKRKGRKKDPQSVRKVGSGVGRTAARARVYLDGVAGQWYGRAREVEADR